MQTESATRPETDAPLIGGDELAEGLMLVRASTLKIIRLQLAMERRDRRVALEAVDDLVALDRRLQQYLADVPAVHGPLLLKREVEAERDALNHEKLTLAAEMISAPRTWDPPAEPVAEPETAMVDEWVPAWELPPEEESRRGWWKVIAVVALLLALVAGAYLITSPEALTRLLEVAGGVS